MKQKTLALISWCYLCLQFAQCQQNSALKTTTPSSTILEPSYKQLKVISSTRATQSVSIKPNTRDSRPLHTEHGNKSKSSKHFKLFSTFRKSPKEKRLSTQSFLTSSPSNVQSSSLSSLKSIFRNNAIVKSLELHISDYSPPTRLTTPTTFHSVSLVASKLVIKPSDTQSQSSITEANTTLSQTKLDGSILKVAAKLSCKYASKLSNSRSNFINDDINLLPSINHIHSSFHVANNVHTHSIFEPSKNNFSSATLSKSISIGYDFTEPTSISKSHYLYLITPSFHPTTLLTQQSTDLPTPIMLSLAGKTSRQKTETTPSSLIVVMPKSYNKGTNVNQKKKSASIPIWIVVLISVVIFLVISVISAVIFKFVRWNKDHGDYTLWITNMELAPLEAKNTEVLT